MWEIIRENQRVLGFLGKVVLLIVLFSFLNRVFFEPSGTHSALIDVLGISATGILQLFGYSYSYENALIYHFDEPILGIGSTCDGLSFILLFISFVLAYPAGSFGNKLWFSLVGTVTIHLLNTIRAVLLVLNFTFSASSFDFNHKYTFVVIVYGIVLWMWITWAKRNAQTEDKAKVEV